MAASSASSQSTKAAARKLRAQALQRGHDRPGVILVVRQRGEDDFMWATGNPTAVPRQGEYVRDTKGNLARVDRVIWSSDPDSELVTIEVELVVDGG